MPQPAAQESDDCNTFAVTAKFCYYRTATF